MTRGEQLLKELKAKGLKSARPSFPDFYGNIPPSPCTNRFTSNVTRKEKHPDAIDFPVAHLHKQGLQLITPAAVKSDLQWYGGKKS